MKSVLNRLGYVFTFLFIVAIIAASYYVYNLPAVFVERVAVIDMARLQEINPILDQVNMVVLGLGFIGLIALMLVITGKNDNAGNVVYVDRFKEKNQETDETEEERRVNGSIYEEKVKEVKALLQQDGGDKLIFNRILSRICKDMEASQGAVYLANYEEEKRYIELFAAFAYSVPDSERVQFEFGEGLAGQVAKTGKLVNLRNVPDGYIQIISGLGAASPTNLIIIPLIQNEKIYGVMEIASFTEFKPEEEDFLKVVSSYMARHIAPEEKVVPEIEENKNG